MEMKFCQSCAMPLGGKQEELGTNADGSKNSEYCCWCYKDGAFTADISMQEMIDFCAGPMVEHNPEMSREEALQIMQKYFPTLKRWKK